MNLTTTLLFYLVIGSAVGVAVYLTNGASVAERWFQSTTAVFFWPLYLPTLLQGHQRDEPGDAFATNEKTLEPQPKKIARDEIEAAIQQVEAELDLALNSLDGWSDSLLSREAGRFAELRTAWYAQAQKIRELDSLLANTALSTSAAAKTAENSNERVVHSERARRENIARLRAVRERLHRDLWNTLAWVRELVTMIHLAKYTGAPASRAEELVVQIATAVEGLSEVAAWKEDDVESATNQSVPC